MSGQASAGSRSNLSPLPPEAVHRPAMTQNWDCITFLHWRYDPGLIQWRLPRGLTVETMDGSAWVGLTPFVTRVRPPGAPPPLSLRFPETNVRTYVTGPGGKPGVWFFSLDAAAFSAVMGARLFYRLPYKWSKMGVRRRGSIVRYRMRRRWPNRGPGGCIEVEVDGPIAPVELGDLDHFLTARFRLYTVLPAGLAYAQVEHPPWPLATARVLRLEQDLIQAAGLPPPAKHPLVHFSPGGEVGVAAPKIL